ncbi:MAG: TrkA family potassium uptake protein [Eubacteriales bacterium]
MKAIIVGCGKLGAGLALSLIRKGHTVTIIDIDPAAFQLLGQDFKGEKIVGVGFDRDILEQARIRSVDAVIACSKSDDANALIGRMARNIYKVPHVISRLYDPRRAEIYRSLGIQTISTTTWGVLRAIEMLSYSGLDSVLTIGDSNVEIIRIDVPPLLIGRTVNELTAIGEIQVVAVSRGNKSFMPTLGTVLQQDDIIYISVISSAAKRLESLLGRS